MKVNFTQTCSNVISLRTESRIFLRVYKISLHYLSNGKHKLIHYAMENQLKHMTIQQTRLIFGVVFGKQPHYFVELCLNNNH